MSLELTPEQRLALANSNEPCLHLHDPQTNKVYLLIEQGTAPEIEQDHLRYMQAGLEAATNQVAKGDLEPWDATLVRSRGEAKLDNRDK